MLFCYLYLKCRSDFEFSEVDPPPREISSLGDDRSSTVTDARAVDHFPHEEIDGISDPVLELHLASPLQPLHHSSPNDILMPVLPQLPSPDKDVEGEMEIDQKGFCSQPSSMYMWFVELGFWVSFYCFWLVCCTHVFPCMLYV